MYCSDRLSLWNGVPESDLPSLVWALADWVSQPVLSFSWLYNWLRKAIACYGLKITSGANYFQTCLASISIYSWIWNAKLILLFVLLFEHVDRDSISSINIFFFCFACHSKFVKIIAPALGSFCHFILLYLTSCIWQIRIREVLVYKIKIVKQIYSKELKTSCRLII